MQTTQLSDFTKWLIFKSTQQLFCVLQCETGTLKVVFPTTTTHAVQTHNHFASGPFNDLCGLCAQSNQNTKGNQTKLCTRQE